MSTRALALTLATLTALALAAAIGAFAMMMKPLQVPAQGDSYWLAPGASMTTMVRDLADRGALPHPQLTLWWGRLTGIDQRLQSGEYSLSSSIGAAEFLRRVDRGEVIQHRLALVEGWTFRRALKAIHDAGLHPSLRGRSDAEILEILDVQGRNSPEGLIFPDTYAFHRGQSDVDMLRVAHRRLVETLSEEWLERDADLPYRDAYDALIMASIIEKETAIARERSAIAGVLTRRLRQRMRLAADPTVIYGLGKDFDGDLNRGHLRDAGNPYNTYRIRGLPPTPIALAGRAAIRAALHPDAGESLYFVADDNGGHVFSNTLEEHRMAVRRYQQKER